MLLEEPNPDYANEDDSDNDNVKCHVEKAKFVSIQNTIGTIQLKGT